MIGIVTAENLDEASIFDTRISKIYKVAGLMVRKIQASFLNLVGVLKELFGFSRPQHQKIKLLRLFINSWKQNKAIGHFYDEYKRMTLLFK